MLLITHDLGLVARYAQRRRGAAEGPAGGERRGARRCCSAPREAYTRRLIDALPRRARRGRGARDRTDAVIEAQSLLGDVLRAQSRLVPRATPTRAVPRVSLAIHAGETVAVVGGSRLGQDHARPRDAAACCRRPAGEVRFDGAPLRTAPRAQLREFRLASQLVFQDPYSSLDPRMRVGDIVAEPLLHVPDRSTAPSASARRERMLDEVGLGGYARPLSARALRRPAPARRDRARHRAPARPSWSPTSRSRRST